MCFYNIFSFECGCESQPPTFICPCPPSHTSQRAFHPDSDRHRDRPQSCRLLIIHQERITPGKCASHRAQAQVEKKVRELKKEIKLLKDDVAEYEGEIDRMRAARRARNRGCLGRGGQGA